MPKMKTKRAAMKRFTITGRGKIKRSQANKRHILTKKTRKRKNRLGKPELVSSADYPGPFACSRREKELNHASRQDCCRALERKKKIVAGRQGRSWRPQQAVQGRQGDRRTRRCGTPIATVAPRRVTSAGSGSPGSTRPPASTASPTAG